MTCKRIAAEQVRRHHIPGVALQTSVQITKSVGNLWCSWIFTRMESFLIVWRLHGDGCCTESIAWRVITIHLRKTAYFQSIHLFSTCVFWLCCSSAVLSDSSSSDVRYALPYQIAVIYSGQTFCASQVLQDRTGLDLGFYVIFMLICNLVDMWFWNACNLVPPVPRGILRVLKKSTLSKACFEG